MRKVLMMLMILTMVAVPVTAVEFNAPSAPEHVQDLMPVQQESFGRDLWKIVQSAVSGLRPNIASAAVSCLALVAVVLLASLFNGMPGSNKTVVRFVCTLAVGTILLGQTNNMVSLCTETVEELSEYGKLLLPVMTGALAAQGGTAGATALYTGTVIFDAVLSSLVGKLLVPLVYLFLVLAIANSATGEQLIKKLRDLLKWLMTWGLKVILYVFTGYLSITRVISGVTDAAAVKAAKLAITGAVPVVGGILSDASEAVILSAGVMKSAAGVYGMIALTAIWISPFLQIGVQYLMLKLTASLCGVFGVKEASELIGDFSGAMGLLLGMAGTVCLLLLISTVCFMKGMT